MNEISGQVEKILSDSIDYFVSRSLPESGTSILTKEQARTISAVANRLDSDLRRLLRLISHKPSDITEEIVDLISRDEDGDYVNQVDEILNNRKDPIRRYNKILRRVIGSYQIASNKLVKLIESSDDPLEQISQRPDKIKSRR